MVVMVQQNYAVARVVQYIMTQSAKALKENILILSKVYFAREGIWSRSYCISCIGLDVKGTLGYVERQEKDDKGQLQLTF
jgi:hypothetical protein